MSKIGESVLEKSEAEGAARKFSVRARDASTSDGKRVVEVRGEVDVFSSHAFKVALARELDDGNYDVVVDLSRVPYMDSTGLGVLVSAYKKAREHDGKIGLAGLNHQLAKIFDMTGLCRVFDVMESV